MKWILFSLSLIALFVANNALFWLPGKYDWFNFVAAGIAILFSAVFTWFSSKRFAKTPMEIGASWKSMLLTPPSLTWVCVISLFLCGGVLKLATYFAYH